jgi:short-subunit dehydrogenase
MKEWALITGASAGIGRELAQLFAAGGHNVALVARSEDRLATLAKELKGAHGIEARVIPADLALPGAAAAVFEQARELEIEVLVNNAGVGHYGEFARTDLRAQTDLIQVNVGALVELTHYFVKPMLKRNRGRILNVASVAAFQPGPTVNAYYASKAFVYSFSYALANELASGGITVTTLCPGTTHTEFFERAGIHMKRPWPMTSARKVAELGYRATMRGRRVAIPGLMNRVMARVSPCLPSRWTSAIVKKVHEA